MGLVAGDDADVLRGPHVRSCDLRKGGIEHHARQRERTYFRVQQDWVTHYIMRQRALSLIRRLRHRAPSAHFPSRVVSLMRLPT